MFTARDIQQAAALGHVLNMKRNDWLLYCFLIGMSKNIDHFDEVVLLVAATYDDKDRTYIEKAYRRHTNKNLFSNENASKILKSDDLQRFLSGLAK